MGIWFDKVYLFLVGGLVYLITRLVLFFVKNKNKKSNLIKKEVIYLGIFIYSILVIAITLFPLRIGGNSYAVKPNVIPVFNTIKDIASDINAREDMRSFMIVFWIKNISGNLLMFFPLGIILGLYLKKIKNIKWALMFGFMVSLSIEVIQYLSCFIGNNHRSPDIDDLILNTLGCALGFAFYKVFIKNRKLENILKVN